MAEPDIMGVYTAFASGAKSLKEAGTVADTPENRAYWKLLEERAAKLGPGQVVDFPYEFPDPDKETGYDHVIDKMADAYEEYIRKVEAGEDVGDDWLLKAMQVDAE